MIPGEFPHITHPPPLPGKPLAQPLTSLALSVACPIPAAAAEGAGVTVDDRTKSREIKPHSGSASHGLSCHGWLLGGL